MKKIIANIDVHMQEVLRGALLAFILKASGAVLSFGFNIIIARLVGAEGTGIYFLAFSITTIGSVIGRIGLDNTLLRYVATYATHGDWDKVKGVHSIGIRMSILISGIVTLILFITAPWLAEHVFTKPTLGEPLRWMSLSILPFALLNLQAQSLKGLKRIRNAMLVQGIGLPLISIVLIYPLVKTSGVIGVIWAYTIAATIVSLLGALAWKQALSSHPTSPQRIHFKELLSSCIPLFIVALMNRGLMAWAPVMLLGIWASSEEVGLFGAATRVSLLVSFLLVAVNNVVAPKFAELKAKENWTALGKTARQTALFITILASPLFILLIFKGEWIMMFFGEDFKKGSTILAVLALGQLINVICGSVGYLLTMSGYERSFRNITIVSAFIQLVLTIVLTPKLGGLGAAIASSAALATMNIAATYAVYSKLGIITVPGLWRKKQ